MPPLVTGPDHGRDHHRKESKAGALNDRQTRAHRTDANGLDQRGNACKQDRHLDHVDQCRDIRSGCAETETGGAGHDNGGRDVGDKHRQHMLDAQRHGGGEWWRIIRVPQLFSGPDRSVCHWLVLCSPGVIVMPVRCPPLPRTG